MAHHAKTAKEIILQNGFLLANIQGGIVYSDIAPPFHLRYATEGMAVLSGYSVEELCQMQQIDLVMPADVDSLLAAVTDQLSRGDVFSVEYRLKRKDGSCVHILDRAKVVLHENGEKFIHCLLTDVSDMKKMEQALRLNQEKYRLAIQQSGNVIVEYSIDTDEISFSENWPHIFGCPTPMGTLSQIIAQGWVDAGYEEKFENLFEETLKNGETYSMEFVLKTPIKTNIWCSLYLTPVLDNGQLYSVVGCLGNINDKKQELEHLTELSQKDSLTGVYNRYAIEKSVQRQMENLCGAEASALFIIDIDNFKQINDRYGHDCGDEVLIKLSQHMMELLPKHATFGRLGGDEFLVFLVLKRADDDLATLATHLVTGVKRAFGRCKTPITISIGAAWHTPSCNTFKGIYKHADIALYKTKEKGRDGFTIYQD